MLLVHDARVYLLYTIATLIFVLEVSRMRDGASTPLSNAAVRTNTARLTPVVAPVGGHKTVLVTGAAGFIASHVAYALLERGDTVVVIDNMNTYYSVALKQENLNILKSHRRASKHLKIYKGDITDEKIVAKIFSENKISYVCHLAARAGVRPSVENPFVYVESNVRGTTQLLEMARQHKIINFVYASSSSVYGGLKSRKFSESASVDHPWSPYAATKKSCELMAATYHHLYALNTTGLRFFTVYGPRGRPDMAPFKFIDRISRGVAIDQYGDGSAIRDFTYIDDIVHGILRSIDRPYPCEVMNLGRGEGIELREFIRLVQLYVGKSAKINVLPVQTGDVPYTTADISKAKRLLGYNPQVHFEVGIRKTTKWYNKTYIIPGL